MSTSEAASRRLFQDLKPGDRVKVTHAVKVGLTQWDSVTSGVVEGKERRRHSLHYRRASDDKVYSDVLLLRRDDGELTTVTMDEFTTLHRLS